MYYKSIKILFLLTFFWGSKVISQNRVVFNNNTFLVIDNSAYFVIDNNSSNAITLVGTGGNIISENEFDRVKWNIGTTSGTYIVPFSKSSGNKIPLSTNITAAGAGAGTISFSTYGGLGWDNNTYKPTDVTSMAAACCGANNSANVIDRFWIIDALGYTTKPSSSITFTYLDAEWIAPNTITESSLFAQRFNSTINDWGDWLGIFSTANITTNQVTSGNITPANFYRSFTLVNQNTPLPIELLYFKATCKQAGVTQFEWATATEMNNDFFTIQMSSDAVTWFDIAKINGAGNSVVTLNYSYTGTTMAHENGGSISYYRLKQTDFNGQFSYSKIESNTCIDASINDFSIYPNPSSGNFNLLITNAERNSISITINNALGQLILKREISFAENNHTEQFSLSNYPKGIYFLTTKTSTKVQTQKIIIE